MTGEGQIIEYKSLRMFTARNPDWNELAKDCVCFANARGGAIKIGYAGEKRGRRYWVPG